MILTDAGISILNDAKYLVDYATRAEEKAREMSITFENVPKKFKH